MSQKHENENIKDMMDIKKRSQWADIWHHFKKNKAAIVGMMLIVLFVCLALFAPLIGDYQDDALKMNIRERLQSPSADHWFGTDEFGRDIFIRIVYGTRISLFVGIISVSIALSIGGFLGSIAGYYGGKIDNAIMRVLDVILAIPAILLAITIVAALGASIINLMIAIGIATIILKHVLPNSMAPIIVFSTLKVATAIMATASLSFIGLGVQPPTPEWGSMLAGGRAYIRDYMYIVLYPGLAIVLSVLSLNLIGDGLRDALDPKLK